MGLNPNAVRDQFVIHKNNQRKTQLDCYGKGVHFLARSTEDIAVQFF